MTINTRRMQWVLMSMGKGRAVLTVSIFRIENESWQELADLVLSLGPHDVVYNCKYWKYNEGDGLDDENAKLLAATLDADLASGKVDRYIAEHTNELYRESVERFVAFLKGCGGFKID